MAKRIRFVTISGFLGAGKTTTMLKVMDALKQRGIKSIYVANDQGQNLVDTALSRANGVAAGEVTGGCFCCQFDDLVETTMRLVEEHKPDVVLAEAVGSCSDLVSTVIRPLKLYYGEQFDVAPYTVLVDPKRFDNIKVNIHSHDRGEIDKVAYLFGKQLEEAQVVALNKLDLLSEEESARLQKELSDLVPTALVFAYSAQIGTNLDRIVSILLNETMEPPTHSVDIDYDIYAEAEAELAWVNMMVEVAAKDNGGFRPAQWMDHFMRALGKKLVEMNSFIGHLKVQMNTVDGYTKVSVVSIGGGPVYTSQQWAETTSGEVFINARVKIEPELMTQSIRDAVKIADQTCGTSSTFGTEQAFRPSRPRPTHRILV